MLIFRELSQTFFYIFDKIVDSLQFHFVAFLQFSFIVLQVILQNESCAHLCFPDARMCISVICSQSCVVSYPQKRMAALASSAVGSTVGAVRPVPAAAIGSSVQPSKNTSAPRAAMPSVTARNTGP